MTPKYGKITNIATDFTGVNRIGDYGKDKDGIMFCYLSTGWRPTNLQAYEINYWKKKYLALKKKISNQ
jgi:hypothetical protein